jgi:hypothetical protein
MDNDQSGVDFEYLFARDYKIVPANTVFSSVSEHEIKVDFGVECIAIPKTLKHKRIGGVVQTNQDMETTNYIRTMQVGIVMSLPQAEMIANHILGQIAKYKGQKKA